MTLSRHVGRALGRCAVALVLSYPQAGPPASASDAREHTRHETEQERGSSAVDDAAAIHVPAFDFPESSLLSEQTRAIFKGRLEQARQAAAPAATCPSNDGVDAARAKEIEQCEAAVMQNSAQYKSVVSRYPVLIGVQKIAGVSAEVFTPTQGIARGNEQRVLLNLHSGGFIGGWLTNSRLESIPIASVGRIKVISIDYRESPVYAFPAATEDAVAVYRELLKRYQPGNIGIYGCSAGGLLTAETVAWLQKENLPLPGAIGIFCSGAAYWAEGDSGAWTRAIEGRTSRMNGTSNMNPYFKNTDPNDALAFPVRSTAVMSRFPPTLLISATRDIALSSAVYTHSVLVDQGVDARLHVWEGLWHAFFNDSDFPESRRVYAVITKFFDSRLGK